MKEEKNEKYERKISETEKEMENLKEELKMTRFGQMLWNDGKMEGRE